MLPLKCRPTRAHTRLVEFVLCVDASPALNQRNDVTPMFFSFFGQAFILLRGRCEYEVALSRAQRLP